MSTIKDTFPVTGMHCASCVLNVENALKSVQGLVIAGVNLASATAHVEFDPSKTNAVQLKKAVTAAGYDLIIEKADSAPEKLEALKKQEFAILRMKTKVAALITAPLVVIGMFAMHMPYASYIMWALATPVVIFSGKQFYIGAFKQGRHGKANMDTLVALSTGIAYLFSVFNTLCPWFWTSRGLMPDVYFEASAVVITFILLGKLLESRAISNTSSALKKLIGLQPNTVNRVKDNVLEEVVSVNEVVVNDLLVVKPGEKIAVDGLVTEGNSFVDESMISGESMPVEKTKGNRVFAGTINQKGSFRFRAEKVGRDTLLANIIKKVQEAQGSKAPVQNLVDKIASVFVPVVIGIALLSLILWVCLGGANVFTHGLMAMVTVLVIACPCALGLATPTAIIAGMGKGAGNGILIKDAASLETAHKINTVALDKTGTITEGHPSVTDIAWKEGTDVALLSSILYSMEARSEHPLGGAVAGFFKNLNTPLAEISSFDSITGSGVTALHDHNIYFAGSEKLLRSMALDIPEALERKAAAWISQANTVVWLADQAGALAAMTIADSIKPGSADAVTQLRNMGIEVYMLTGDSMATATAIAGEAGISQFRAELSPMQKADFIRELRSQGKIVAMAGDGINDSPALAQADVSIAMGRGTDIAMETARMTLVSSDLKNIPRAINLSRKTVGIIRQNLFWAFIYNVIGIPIAAGLLYPINGFLLNPMIAGAAMALSSVSVVSNSLRLKWGKLE
jgi:Cu2+-exporting ATPase